MAIYEAEGLLNYKDILNNLYKMYPITRMHLVEGLNDELKKYLLIDGTRGMLGNLSMNGKKVTGLGTPTDDGDASTKKYVDEGFVKKSGDTMSGALLLPNDSGFFAADGSWHAIPYKTPDGKKRCELMLDNTNRFHINQRITGASHAERYLLPALASDLTGDKWYEILTSKNPATIAQGGTGATTAAQALANLGGRNTIIKRLWQNASWTSSFADQAVTWTDDGVTYDAYIVTFVYSTSYGYEFSVFVNNYLVHQGRNGSMYYAKGSPTSGTNVLDAINRNFSVYGAGNGCSFGTGYLNGSGNNAYAIPMSIYGIKW